MLAKPWWGLAPGLHALLRSRCVLGAPPVGGPGAAEHLVLENTVPADEVELHRDPSVGSWFVISPYQYAAKEYAAKAGSWMIP